MDIGTPQVTSKVIVIPNGETMMRVTTKTFEVTSGVPIQFGTSDDYTNGIVFNSHHFSKFR